MPDGARQIRRQAAPRLVIVLVAMAALQGFAVAAATPLVPTESLAPSPTVAPQAAEVVVEAAASRQATKAAAGTRIVPGWSHVVAAGFAKVVYGVRRRQPLVPATAVRSEQGSEIPDPDETAESLLPVVTTLAGLTVVDDPASPFRLAIDKSRRVVTVTVDGRPDIGFEVDYRDRASDLHRIGLTPILLGHRLEGAFLKREIERTYPLVTPTFDAGKVTYTTITSEDGVLVVRFDGGPYANLRTDGEGTTYVEIRTTVTSNKVRMDLSGLYYVRPAVGAGLEITAPRGTTSLAVTEDRSSFLKYFDEPTKVEISDAGFGDYRMHTDVSLLQVQWNGTGTAFELDFDHAYKDRGQDIVESRLIFPIPVQVEQPASGTDASGG